MVEVTSLMRLDGKGGDGGHGYEVGKLESAGTFMGDVGV